MEMKEMKVGDKINCWTIININPPPEHRYHLLCRCVCGNEKWVSRSTLRRGKSKSCGCRKHRSQKEYNLKPGDNVGYWTILSNDGDKFRCRCICGTERVIKHNILKNGRSLSWLPSQRSSDKRTKRRARTGTKNIARSAKTWAICSVCRFWPAEK